MPNPLLQNENQELLYVEVYSQYSAGSGIDITSGVISLDPYISASIDSKLASADFGTYSAGVAQDIAYVSANAGKTYSGISPIVVNDTTISADNFDLIIGSGLAFENNTLYVSAQQGNPDVESLVQTNSGLWNEITGVSSTYQPIGSYATTTQLDTASSYLSGQIDNKLDKNEIGFDNDNTYVTGISGKEISASIAYKSYSSTYAYLADNADNALSAQTAQFDENGHSLSSTYSSLYDLSSFVNSSSGAWNDGKTYEGIAPIVVNNTTNEISADSQDITFGTGLDFTSGILSVTAQGGDPEVESVVKANSGDWGTITALSSTSAMLSGAIDYVSGNAGTTYTGVAPIVVNGNTISADSFDLTIGSGLAFENDTLYVSAQGGNPEVESYVQTNSASIDDAVSTYETNSASYITQETDWTNTITAASSYAYNEAVSQIPTPFDPTYISGVIDNKLDKSDIGFDNNTYVTGISGKEISASRANNATYATESFMADQANNAMIALTAKYDEKGHRLSATYSSLYDLSSFVNINSADWNDATTAYQTNSASYMTKPNLEYNAVNEISGYNGSAIAQYGAEKQWLQHDDTIVHVSNSAQYAFGVNLSAVAKLMGIDQTVLYSGTATYTGSLNESVENFDTIKVNYITDDGMQGVSEFMPSYNKEITLNSMYVAQNSAIWFKSTNYTFSANTSFSSYPYQLFKANNGITAAWSNNTSNTNFRITRVIGIGRKA